MGDVYYFYNTASYDSQSAPSPPAYTARLFGSSRWYDGGSYAVILSYSSTSIKVRLYRGNAVYLDNAYQVHFRFHT
jgi:hypothetical protein